MNQASYNSATSSLVLGTPVYTPVTYPWQQKQDVSLGTFSGTSAVAWPEHGEMQVVRAVRGTMIFQPDTWTLGTRYKLTCRLVVRPMDEATDGAIIDPVEAPQDYFFANEKFLWQWGPFLKTFSTSNDMEVFNIAVKWKGYRRLEKNEAVYMWIALGNQTNVTMRFETYLRALMDVPSIGMGGG